MPNLVPPRPAGAGQPASACSPPTARRPIAGLLFAVLALISRSRPSPRYHSRPTGQPGAVLQRGHLRGVGADDRSRCGSYRGAAADGGSRRRSSVAKSIWDGWRFLGRTQVVRGIVIGMVGAFAAGGVVVGLGPAYVGEHPAGRRRGLGAGVRGDLHRAGRRDVRRPAHPARLLPAAAVRPVHRLRGAAAGADRADPQPGRGHHPGRGARRVRRASPTSPGTPSSAWRSTTTPGAGRSRSCSPRIRVILFAVIAIAPIAGGRAQRPVSAITGSQTLRIANVSYGGVGDNMVLLLAAAVASVLGTVSYRQMDDRAGHAAAGRPGRGAARRAARRRCQDAQPRPSVHPPDGAGCCWPWRAARARASRPRPGCWRSGCATRATTCWPRTSPAPPRSACGCARCCWTPRTPG